MLNKVQTLKKELQDWRTKLDGQVKSYRSEIADLRKTLNSEVESLRTEFLDLKAALKQQLGGCSCWQSSSTMLLHAFHITSHNMTNSSHCAELTSGLAAEQVVDAERKAAGLSS